METKSFGLLASWRTLTSSQGWWKPIALLTLVSWIPIAGQIAVMGCALEWGRFAAWGSNEPPRWESINYSKLLKTGARAFIIQVLMAIVFGSALGWAFDGRGVTFSPSGVWPRGSWPGRGCALPGRTVPSPRKGEHGNAGGAQRGHSGTRTAPTCGGGRAPVRGVQD